MSEYADTAIAEVERDKTREILLISPSELRVLFSETWKLTELINKKRESLRDDGKVWLQERHAKPRRVRVELPESDEFLQQGKSRVSSFSFRADSVVMFTRELLSFEPIGAPGEHGVELRLRPSLRTISDLAEYFSQLALTLSLSSAGSFVIHNPGDPGFSWHGVGLAPFIRELENTKARYDLKPQKRSHFKETFSYLAACRGGFIHFEGIQLLERNRLWDAGFTVYLPGIPVDADPFVRLCGRSGNRFATFNPVHHEPGFLELIHQSVVFDDALNLEVVGRVLQQRGKAEDDERLMVSGVVARNPFFTRE